MTDERDFIDFTLKTADLARGHRLSPNELALEFAKLSESDRIFNLMKMEDSDEFSTPRAAARRHMYERALKEAHERLRKIDR
jgi:hypothetical protein